MPLSPIDRTEGLRLEKRECRRHYRALRRSLDIGERRVWDRALCEQILSLPCFLSARMLLAYYPIGDEPDLLPVVQKALELGKQVAFPVCDSETTTMTFRVVRSLDELAVGAYGIAEPTEDCPIVTDFADALCLVPALSFDRRGFRIGYGKGYYDRFLCVHPTNTLGAIYHALLSEVLPTEPTDQAVSHLVTERGILLPNEETHA